MMTLNIQRSRVGAGRGWGGKEGSAHSATALLLLCLFNRWWKQVYCTVKSCWTRQKTRLNSWHLAKQRSCLWLALLCSNHVLFKKSNLVILMFKIYQTVAKIHKYQPELPPCCLDSNNTCSAWQSAVTWCNNSHLRLNISRISKACGGWHCFKYSCSCKRYNNL